MPGTDGEGEEGKRDRKDQIRPLGERPVPADEAKAMGTDIWVSRCCESAIKHVPIEGERTIKRCGKCDKICETMRASVGKPRRFQCMGCDADAFQSILPKAMVYCPVCKKQSTIIEIQDV